MPTVIEIDGVDIRSADILVRDCSFPITNLSRRCAPDQVWMHMPVLYGGWEDGTRAPAITDTNYVIEDTTNGDACLSPIVRTQLDACELWAPDMECLSLSSPVLEWRDLMTKFCRMRNILPKQMCVFNANGTLAIGQDYTLDMVKFALQGVWGALGQIMLKSAMAGDASNPNEFDGLYTQLQNGWASATANPCAPELNQEQVIDWGALTGSTGPATPDAKTIAGQQITIWGETFDVPEGINLAEFLEDLWIDKVGYEFADCAGGVDIWEMHVPWGSARCFLNTAACMKACSDCDDDPDVRERFARFRRTNIATLYPSMTRVPVLQSRYMPANSLRFGPRSIGGRPTYALVIDEIDRYLNLLPSQTYGDFSWSGMADTWMCEDDWKQEIENRGLYWTLDKLSAKCVQGTAALCAGVLACSRHLWLRVDNVTCATLLTQCTAETDVTVTVTPIAAPEAVIA